jgi:hypothetical protein
LRPIHSLLGEWPAASGSPERIRICGVLRAPAAMTTAPASIVWSSPPASAYSMPVASSPPFRSSRITRSTGHSARRSSLPTAVASWMYVFIVLLPALVGQPCRQDPHFMQLTSV